jgi:predicted  nucleic acid-binding Zn-ribbon protein
MPHQCIKCNTQYDDKAEEAIKGCACGSSAFIYTKPQPEKPVLLELESVSTQEDGKYELDVNALFGKKDLIYRDDDGKYRIDLEESFRRHAAK